MKTFLIIALLANFSFSYAIINPISDKTELANLISKCPGTLRMRFGTQHSGGGSYIGEGLIVTARHNFSLTTKDQLHDLFITTAERISVHVGPNDYEVVFPKIRRSDERTHLGKVFIQNIPDIAIIIIKNKTIMRNIGVNKIFASSKIQYTDSELGAFADLIAAGPGVNTLSAIGGTAFEVNQIHFGYILSIDDSESVEEIFGYYSPNLAKHGYGSIASGDSGGPIFIEAQNGELFQVGVNSGVSILQNGSTKSTFASLLDPNFRKEVITMALSKMQIAKILGK